MFGANKSSYPLKQLTRVVYMGPMDQTLGYGRSNRKTSSDLVDILLFTMAGFSRLQMGYVLTPKATHST